MSIFIQNNATGAGGGGVDPTLAFANLMVISNGDTGLGLGPQVGNRQQVTYARSLPGAPPTRLDTLVNTAFNPNYGGGPQLVNIIILSVLSNFVLNDGTMITAVGGTALPPNNSGLLGAGLNNTNDCLVIYDTSQSNGNGYCTARLGTGGTLDLQSPNAVILYHELSHAFRTVTNTSLALTNTCNPSSPEENAAITDENDLRTQIATATSTPVVLRDPGIHCAALCTSPPPNCCIIASVASGSPISEEVAALRSVRDGFLRRSEVGFSFFESLHHDYYAFSPQVCTLMARHAELRPLVLEGLVRPLVSALRLIERYARGCDAAALGGQFVAEHADAAAGAERLAMLRRAQEVLEGVDAPLTEAERELTRLLRPALDSRHVRWAIIEPVQIYQSAMRAHLDGCGLGRLCELLYDSVCAWGARMPLDHVWGALNAAELRQELGMLDGLLLRTEGARASFRGRLKREFGGVTAIAAMAGARAPEIGVQG